MLIAACSLAIPPALSALWGVWDGEAVAPAQASFPLFLPPPLPVSAAAVVLAVAVMSVPAATPPLLQ